MNLLKDEGEKGKESPVVPQPKPPRQPPEVKPKPKMCAPGPSTASAHSHNDEEEEDDNKVMKERQVCSVTLLFLKTLDLIVIQGKCLNARSDGIKLVMMINGLHLYSAPLVM